MEMINEKNFDEKVKNGVVLVDFYATWCGPCRMMVPILEDIQEEFDDSVEIFKVDVDENESLARKFGIMSIPTLYIFVDGEIKEKHIGLWNKDDLSEVLHSYVEK